MADHLSIFQFYGELVQKRIEKIPERSILIFAIFALTTIFLQKLFRLLRFPLSFKFLLFIVAIAMGILLKFYENKVFEEMDKVNPKIILLIFHPIYLVKTGFDVERHIVHKVILQVMLLCIGGLIFVTIFMGLAVSNMSTNSTNFFVVMLGISLSSIDNIDQISALKEYESLRYVLVMLECESILGISLSLVILNIFFGISEGYITKWYQFALVLTRFVLGGIGVGLLITWRVQLILTRYCVNLPISVLGILTIVYSVYYLCEFFLYFSGPIASMIVVFAISFEKTRLHKDLCSKLSLCWNALNNMTEYILYFCCTIIAVHYFRSKIDVTLISQNIMSYILSSLGRLVTTLLLIPVIVHMGTTTQYKSTVTMYWLGKKGVWQILIYLMIVYENILKEYALEFLPFLLFLIGQTLLINGSTGLCCLRLFGVTFINNIKKNNIKNCMEFIEAKKKRFFATVKINGYYSDTSWDVADEQTTIPIPKGYIKGIGEHGDDEEDDKMWGKKQSFCPDCRKEITITPTAKDISMMTTEAKIKILKTHKICSIREHEKGLLSATALRPLMAAIESAMDDPKLILQVNVFISLCNKKTWFQSLKEFLVSIDSENVKLQPPRKLYRRICYKICINNTYEIFLYFIIIFLFILMSFEVKGQITLRTTYVETAIFFIDFLLKLFSHSHIYIKEGFALYFKSHWNKIDFTILMSNFVSLALLLITGYLVDPDYNISADVSMSSLVVTLDFLASLRLLKIVVILYEYRKIFMSLCDTLLHTRISFLLDIVQSLLVSYDEVLRSLPSIAPYADVRKSLESKLAADRKCLIHEIVRLEMNYPGVAVTIKTKKAMRYVMYNIREAALELKAKGFIDNSDFIKYINIYEVKMKQIQKIKHVDFKNHENTFYEVPWMWNSHDLSIFLYINSSFTTFRPGATIIECGEYVKFVYVVVEGYAFLDYNPRTDYIEIVGSLPVKDYINSTNFQNHKEEVIIPGNSIGELGVLTNRKSNCSVTCETEVKAFIIPSKLLFDAMMYKDTKNCLFNDMWTFISVHFAVVLLWETIIYKHYTRQDLYQLVLNSFIPDLSDRYSFVSSEKVRDLILIEGVVDDINSNDIYYAPCFIPRAAQRLILKKKVGLKIDPKLMIIPSNKGDKADIMKYQDIKLSPSREIVDGLKLITSSERSKGNKPGDLKSILKSGK